MSKLRYIARRVWHLVDSLYFLCTYGRPNSQFRYSLVSKYTSHPMFNRQAQQLVDEGILILPSYYSGDILKQMQMDFEKWVPQEPNKADHDGGYWLDRKCLEDSIQFSRAAVDPYLNDLVAYYWGKSIYLAEICGKRLEPCEPYEAGSFQWHHDAIRKQIKVFIFLTDVPENGQVMEYIPKTQKIVRWNNDHASTRFSQKEAEKYFKDYSTPVRCSCPAGTVVIFDTNGVHRGNRNRGARRDSWTFNFNGGEKKRFHPVPNLHREVLRGLDESQKRMVRAH